MDVFNVGSGNAPKAPAGGIERSGDTPRGERVKAGSGEKSVSGEKVVDSYAGSEGARKVTNLVDRLIAGPDGEIRVNLVEQFKALLQIGGLDTPERMEKAADQLLQG
jgi:hypothetical protein